MSPEEEVTYAEEAPPYNKLTEDEKPYTLFTDGSYRIVEKHRRWKAAVWSPTRRVAEAAEGEGESSQFAENDDSAVTLEQSDFDLSISAINKTGGDSTHSRRVDGNLGQVINFHGTIQDAVKVSSNGIVSNSLNCDPDPSDIYLHNPNVKWDDIIGLDAAKRLVKEAVYPIRAVHVRTIPVPVSSDNGVCILL
ncbi:katanin p60 ATPase-containing subunit A-like 2 [Grus japonensis]|uniref:Katanin p60 ATPase-containing subunit A-like 2 n=1 Tax=Grus japonensis TaxID=30415 RepID=A0ABC9YDK1_GRUJA